MLGADEYGLFITGMLVGQTQQMLGVGCESHAVHRSGSGASGSV